MSPAPSEHPDADGPQALDVGRGGVDWSSDPLLSRWMRSRARPLLRIGVRHQAAVEALGVLLLVLACLGSQFVQGRLSEPDGDVFCLLLPGALLLRRRSLRGMFALLGVIALVQWFVSTPQNTDVAVLIGFFWVMLDGDLPTVAGAAFVVELGAAMAALRWAAGSERYWVGITGLAIAFGAVGLVLRERRALVLSMGERAARLQFERDQEGRLATAAERTRIAREMHDIVSHNLTVVVGLADGAAYALSADPESSRAALDAIAGTGRQALTDMRRLLGVLREGRDPDRYEPQPGIARIAELLDGVRAAGIPVDTAVDADTGRLPDVVQLAIYRVAQEALTNTLKHAGRPARAWLSLRCLPDHIELEVIDSGLRRLTGTDGVSVPGGGRGLTGMRERASAFGGQLQAGPRPDGVGWRVHLTLPMAALAEARR